MDKNNFYNKVEKDTLYDMIFSKLGIKGEKDKFFEKEKGKEFFRLLY